MIICNMGRLQMLDWECFNEIDAIVHKATGLCTSAFDNLDIENNKVSIIPDKKASDKLKAQGPITFEITEEMEPAFKKLITDWGNSYIIKECLEPIPLFSEYNLKCCFADLRSYNEKWLSAAQNPRTVYLLQCYFRSNHDDKPSSIKVFSSWKGMLDWAKSHKNDYDFFNASFTGLNDIGSSIEWDSRETLSILFLGGDK